MATKGFGAIVLLGTSAKARVAKDYHYYAAPLEMRWDGGWHTCCLATNSIMTSVFPSSKPEGSVWRSKTDMLLYFAFFRRNSVSPSIHSFYYDEVIKYLCKSAIFDHKFKMTLPASMAHNREGSCIGIIRSGHSVLRTGHRKVSIC